MVLQEAKQGIMEAEELFVCIKVEEELLAIFLYKLCEF